MSTEVCLPALSDSMESGNLASWLVKEGDTVALGDVIAEIEMDKAMMELESSYAGVIGKILVEEGTEDVLVGTPIAILLQEGESLQESESQSGVEPQDVEVSSPVEQSAVVAEETPAIAVKEGQAALADDGDGRVKASPLARNTAGAIGLSLTGIKGSGPNGRIVKRDIERAGSQGNGAAAEPPADVPYKKVKLSKTRKVIAQRLLESKQNVPHFYLTVDVELDTLLAQRKDINARLDAEGIKVSVNDCLIKAAALALVEVPAANAQYSDDGIYLFERADISVAVAIEGGLITPVLRGANSKNLTEISAEVKDLAARARQGELKPEDYQGGTFSISNLGMYGVREFSAIVNPPQGAILAVGAGTQRAIVRDGALVPASVMSCTLSCDHRVIDGAIGAEFLSAFKRLIEDPSSWLK